MLKVVHDEAEPNEASGSVLDEIVREAAGGLGGAAGAAGTAALAGKSHPDPEQPSDEAGEAPF